MGSWVRWSVLLVLGLGVLARVLFLDADPQYYEWTGYVTDEGRWIQFAREFWLQGGAPSALVDVYQVVHLLLAPLFQLVNYVVFTIAGLSFVTTRAFSMLCGGGLLILFFQTTKRLTTPQGLLIGTAILAFQVDYIVFSRLAIPEIPALFFLLLSYALLVSLHPSPRRSMLAGLAMLLAVMTKVTVAPVAVIFTVMILARQGLHAGSRAGRQPWRQVLYFWMGIAGPVLLVGIPGAAYLLFSHGVTSPASLVSERAGYIFSHLSLNNLASLVTFPFTHPLAPTFNFLAVGVWASTLAWAATPSDAVGRLEKTHLTASAVWIVGYYAVMQTIAYFPARYMIHIFVPMVVYLTIGAGLVQRLGGQGLGEYFNRAHQIRRVLGVALLSLPTAILLAPLLVGVLELAGLGAPRVRQKLVIVMLLAGAITYVLSRRQWHDRMYGYFLHFPLIGALAWFALSMLPGALPFWPKEGTSFFIPFWIAFLSVTAAISLLVPRIQTHRARQSRRVLATIYATIVVVLAAAKIVPMYLEPHYSMKQTSRDLGAYLRDAESVTTLRGASLFNDNRIPYRHYDRVLWKGSPPDIVVVAFPNQRIPPVIEEDYALVRTFDVYIAPAYFRLHPEHQPTGPLGETVRVYKRKSEIHYSP
jgi:hypothetical protein